MVASSVLWIRQLIHQIEEPMKVFRENKQLMANKVLLQYAFFLFKFFKLINKRVNESIKINKIIQHSINYNNV